MRGSLVPTIPPACNLSNIFYAFPCSLAQNCNAIEGFRIRSKKSVKSWIFQYQSLNISTFSRWHSYFSLNNRFAERTHTHAHSNNHTQCGISAFHFVFEKLHEKKMASDVSWKWKKARAWGRATTRCKQIKIDNTIWCVHTKLMFLPAPPPPLLLCGGRCLLLLHRLFSLHKIGKRILFVFALHFSLNKMMVAFVVCKQARTHTTNTGSDVDFSLFLRLLFSDVLIPVVGVPISCNCSLAAYTGCDALS